MKSVLLMAALLAAPQAFAKLHFEDARIFTVLKGATMTAGYVTIRNDSAEPVELVLKNVEKFKAFESHETIEDAGKMKMQKVDSFKIPAKGTLELKPGGRHLMLFDPLETIKEGATVKVVFTANKKDETVKFKVVPRAQPSEAHSHHH